MDTIKSFLAVAISMAVIGLIFGGVLPGGVLAAVETTPPGPLYADGLAVENLPEAAPDQPAAPAAVAAVGPTYTRTYAGFEFQPGHSDLTYAPVGAGLYALFLPPGSQSFKLPLDLPNGAQVTRLTMYVIDNNPASNITLQITQNDPAASFSQTFPVSISTTNALTSSNIQAISISGTVTPIITIDNSTFDYSLRYQPSITGSNHILVGARIEFSVPTILVPLISR